MDRWREIEWPTLGLIAACYLIWVLATSWAAALWLPLGMAALTLAVTLHSSLQHEVLQHLALCRQHQRIVAQQITRTASIAQLHDRQLVSV